MKPETLKAAFDHALEEYPRESCGLVVAVKRKEIYVRCRNIATEEGEEFRMHPEDAEAAEDMGTVKVVVHSHPDGAARPSEHDRVQCENSALPWLIVAVHADPATPELGPQPHDSYLFEPTGYEAPLRGREFVFGIQDCYTLVQDYYRRELNIELPNFERTDKFWERGENLYMDNFAAAGFEPIPAPTEPGDLILMAIRSDIVNHAGIWLGDRDHMLHHPYRHLSEVAVYGGYWFDNHRIYIRKVK